MSVIHAVDSFLPWVFSQIQTPFLDSVMVALSFLGDGGLIWIVAIVAMLISKKYRRAGIAAAISLLLCYLLGSYVIKPIVGRIRPCNAYPLLELLIERPEDFSFPSMHTATAFSVAIIILCANKKLGIPAVILSVFVALSRVYLHVHYTTDIIAGAVFGTVFALFFCWLFLKRKWSKNT